jgi:hypothetical protein
VSSSSAPPPAPAGAGREHLLDFEVPGRGWGKRRSSDHLRLSPDGATIEFERLLRAPLKLPLGQLQLGLVDRGAARVSGAAGRFAVLRRLSATAVLPREEGIEGWLWTSTGGSALTALGDEDDAPNAALLFTKPLGPELLEGCLHEGALEALAARSPLGVPAVPGLIFRVADPGKAEVAFRAYNLLRPLTDREVPPTMRRHLPSDRPADPAAGLRSDAPRGSVAPPGFS